LFAAFATPMASTSSRYPTRDRLSFELTSANCGFLAGLVALLARSRLGRLPALRPELPLVNLITHPESNRSAVLAIGLCPGGALPGAGPTLALPHLRGWLDFG